MTGFALHSEAYDDLDDIRSYIAEDNPDAADRMVNEIFDSMRQLITFPDQGSAAPTSLRYRYASCPSAITLSRMLPRKSRCGLSPSFMADVARV